MAHQPSNKHAKTHRCTYRSQDEAFLKIIPRIQKNIYIFYIHNHYYPVNAMHGKRKGLQVLRNDFVYPRHEQSVPVTR